jgi:flagellar basal-body rod protein FlgG
MIQGLYAAASGMVALEERQSITANNIANASTPGFKRHQPVQLGFYQVFHQTMRHPLVHNLDAAPGGGAKIVESFPQLAGGVLRATDSPLHAAVQGPGFFVVDTPQGERFTRSGDFSIDMEGHLSTPTGFKVQGEGGGPIDVRGGTINIARDGGVTVDGIPAGRIRVVEFGAPERLLRAGDSLYAANEAVRAQMTGAGNSTVEQSRLEMSNVNLPQEMTSMLLGLRAYEANQRVIQTLDGTLGRLIDQVATPSS